MDVRFEWDRRKAAANLQKHGVAFDEALTVFADPLARIFDDWELGKARLLVISFVSREDAVRLVNARKATRRERDDYEKNVKS